MSLALEFDQRDRQRLQGLEGRPIKFAMELMSRIATATGATRFIDVSQAHLVGSYYGGPADLELIEKLHKQNARVVIPTTLNASSVDLQHGQYYSANSDEVKSSCRLVKLYQQIGCAIELTCAPYHLPVKPKFNQAIAWAESNAIVYANSVIGARTNKTYQYLDLCAALTGRIPEFGLYKTENRKATLVYQLLGIPERWLVDDSFYQLLGLYVGGDAGEEIPVIVNLPASVSDDQLRGLGAAAASSGSLAMFHAVGITPEAVTLDEALHRQQPTRIENIDPLAISAMREKLTTSSSGDLLAVCLGTPHFSLAEFKAVIELLAQRKVAAKVKCYISTSRYVYQQLQNLYLLDALLQANVCVVTDTCTYYGSLLKGYSGRVMTASAKWAYYAPGNLNIDVVFARLSDCIDSAVAGRVVIDESFWQH